MGTITGPDILDMAWDNTTAGSTVTFKVTTDPTVFAHATMRITTNGVAATEHLDAGALANWSRKLKPNQTIVGVIILIFDGAAAATARIVSECRNPDGTIHQDSFDSKYDRTGLAGQPVTVSVE